MQFFSESSSLSFHSSFLEGQVPSGFCQVQQRLQSERLNKYETLGYTIHEFIYLYVSISVHENELIINLDTSEREKGWLNLKSQPQVS